MISTLTVLRIVLTWILAIIVILTGLFILDGYVFHPNIKGISLFDMKQIAIFLVTPLSILIILIRIFEKSREKTNS